MANRLAGATSPYLLQHAGNPVDWWPWGEEAFAEARRRDVPLLISIGYAACHWCHVMAHESFEDEAVAAAMNAGFVSVKVDREERPDVDAVYMAATQAMTGRGGWPMTVFATPEGEPFSCGTYFPPRAAHGLPSFRQVLDAVAQAWVDQPHEVRSSAAGLRRHFAALRSVPLGPRSGVGGAGLSTRTIDVALAALAETFDAARGGFGGAPKFPPSMVLEWLLRHHARTGDPAPLAMVERTLEAMARGGLYDQLGGGFARYSVDADWVVPHFEKMLYDNALLLRVYLHWWRATGSSLARRVAEQSAAWLLRDLRTPEGGFASSLDADSLDGDGLGVGRVSAEGAFYVWTPAQVRAALADDGGWAAEVLGVGEHGTFDGAASVLQLRVDPPAGQERRFEGVRDRLLASRGRRAAPARDDTVVAGWNGLAIAALAEAGALLERPEWVCAAVDAAELLVSRHVGAGRGVVGDRLARTSRGGVPGPAPGVLEDYANVAEGLLVLFGVTGAGRWVEVAGRLLDVVLEHFPDGGSGFFDTADDETDPVLRRLGRPQDPTDGPTPSGAAAAAGALVSYAALTGSSRHRAAAEAALATLAPIAERWPRSAGWALAVAEAVADGPREVAVVGLAGEEGTEALRRAALRGTAPGAVLAVGDPAAASSGEPVALLRGRPLVGGRPAAYVCRQFACEMPTTDPGELARTLGAQADPVR